MIINYLLTNSYLGTKGTKQGSGLRRIVSLAALLVIFIASGVQAQVKIGDVYLSSGNTYTSSSLSFNGIITSGSVYYSGSVLKLTDATIKAMLDINKEGLTVQLVGDCKIQTEAIGVFLRSNISITTLESAGSLTITSSGGTGISLGQYTLTVSGDAVVSAEGKEYGIRGANSTPYGKLAMADNATVEAKGSTMASMRYLEISDESLEHGFTVTSPQGAQYIASRKGVVGTDDSMVSGEWVVFEKAIPINTTNFPDANFCEWLLGQDYGADGYLSTTEIAKVDGINVDNKGIADLTGIEYFTNLTYLICCRNDLTTLDVSKNILLRQILCDRNQIRGKGMNTLVNSLHTSFIDNDWPEDWRPKLIVIHADATPAYNWITQSQVQNAESKGWEVMRYNNQHGYVDYAGELPGIPINEANFHDANFRAYVSGEDIDQDGDGYLNEMEVWWVTEINVSNQNISDLKGIEFFNGLTELDCSYNQLTSLDVSHNMALTRLYCYCNQIRGTAMTKLVNSLPETEDGTLWVYYIDDSPAGNMMTRKQVDIATGKNWNVVMWDDDYEDFIPYEGETPDGIEISEENFPDDNFRAYVSSVAIDQDKDGYLGDEEIVAATEIDVSEKEIKNLSGIEYFKKLEELQCYCNQLTSLNVSECSALTSLNCFGNQLTSLDVSHNTALTYLDCGFNQLSSLDLSKNTALTSLNCFNNQLSSLDVSHNTALERLECYSNQIHGAAMTTLVNSLPDRKSASEKGTFEVYYDETPDGNLMTKLQVKIATDKNWNVWMWDDEEVYDWVPYEGEIIPGDANGDGEVNAKDIETVRNYILGLPATPFSLESADLDKSHTVDIVDLTRLIEMVKY